MYKQDLKTSSIGTSFFSWQPTEPEALLILESICQSAPFAGSKRMIAFLRFVTLESLAGRDEQLTEFSIALDVYGREQSFDPKSDTIVRVEARRLRAKLDEYYRTTGAEQTWRLQLARGSPTVCASRRTQRSRETGKPGSG